MSEEHSNEGITAMNVEAAGFRMAARRKVLYDAQKKAKNLNQSDRRKFTMETNSAQQEAQTILKTTRMGKYF